MDIEESLIEINVIPETFGNKNRYQYMILCLGFLIYFFTGMLIYSLPLNFEKPTFFCWIDGAKTKCSQSDYCSTEIRIPIDWVYKNFLYYNELYCDSDAVDEIFYYVFSYCNIITLVLIYLNDIIGRKKSFILSISLAIFSFVMIIIFIKVKTIVIIFSVIYFSYINHITSVFPIFISENTNNKLLYLGCSLNLIFYALGGIFVNFFILMLSNSIQFFIFFIVILLLIMIMIIFVMKESVYYYYLKNNNKKILEISKSIMKFNKINKEEELESNINKLPNNIKENLGFRVILKEIKKKRNIINFFLILPFFFIVTLVYIMIFNLTENDHFKISTKTRNILSSISELIAYIISYFVLDNLSRKKTIMYYYIIIVILSCLLFINNSFISISITFFIIKIPTCICFCLFFIYENELFNSKLRSLFMAIIIFSVNFLSGISNILIKKLILYFNPLIVNGVLSLIMLIFIPYYQETKGNKIN